jgi:hypothetical protein
MYKQVMPTRSAADCHIEAPPHTMEVNRNESS